MASPPLYSVFVFITSFEACPTQIQIGCKDKSKKKSRHVFRRDFFLRLAAGLDLCSTQTKGGMKITE